MGALVVLVFNPLLEAGGRGFLAKWTGFLAKWTGFSCKVDGVFLQSGRGFLVKWTGFSCMTCENKVQLLLRPVSVS